MTNPRSVIKRLIKDSKYRAKRDNAIHELTEADITPIPKFCPVLLTKMKIPSIDRVDNTIRGYPKNNCRVISNRANTLKGDGTAEEHLLIALYMIKEERIKKESFKNGRRTTIRTTNSGRK